jgi:hypothetical protein
MHPDFHWDGRAIKQTLSARNAVRAQFSDDSLSAWGDPPSPGGGYAERGVNLESMKAGLGAKAKVQRKKAKLEHCIEHPGSSISPDLRSSNSDLRPPQLPSAPAFLLSKFNLPLPRAFAANASGSRGRTDEGTEGGFVQDGHAELLRFFQF